MKKIILVLSFIFIGQGVKACDVCSMYMSIGMNDYKSSIGFSFRSQFFQKTIWEEMIEANPYKHFGESELPSLVDKTIYESYETYELRGHYYFNSKLSIFGSLPFKHTKQMIEDEVSVDISGISDPTLLLKYRLFSSSGDCEAKYTHRTIVGAGLKFPLGATEKQYNGEYVINDMQMGTGSYDIVVSAEHVSMYDKLGLNANVIYFFKTKNLSDYRYGNSYSSQLYLFYNIKNEKRELRPVVGLYAESDEVDFQDGEKQGSTESTRGFINYGLEAVQKSFSVYANYQQAIYNKYTGVQLDAKGRVVAGIKYYIK